MAFFSLGFSFSRAAYILLSEVGGIDHSITNRMVRCLHIQNWIRIKTLLAIGIGLEEQCETSSSTLSRRGDGRLPFRREASGRGNMPSYLLLLV